MFCFVFFWFRLESYIYFNIVEKKKKLSSIGTSRNIPIPMTDTHEEKRQISKDTCTWKRWTTSRFHHWKSCTCHFSYNIFIRIAWFSLIIQTFARTKTETSLSNLCLNENKMQWRTELFMRRTCRGSDRPCSFLPKPRPSCQPCFFINFDPMPSDELRDDEAGGTKWKISNKKATSKWKILRKLGV